VTSLSVTLSERVLVSPKSCILLDFLSLLFSFLLALCYGPVLDRNGRHSTRPLTDTYRDTDPALV
jgi:hypothetical protein